MKKFTFAVLAVAGALMSMPAFAQAQGSNQAADYALSWGAARGGYGEFSHSYARAPFGYQHYRRHWR